MIDSKVALCLPTLNERHSLEAIVSSIRSLDLFDIFISDAGSNDGTRELAAQLGLPVVEREGLGKGYGVQSAFEYAYQNGYDYMAIVDCDMTYDIGAFPRLMSERFTCDMVVGARNMKDIALFRRIGNMIHIQAINLLFQSKLTDINSGMRIMRVEKFHQLIDSKNFDVEAQITCRALKNDLKIVELPVDYGARTGESKIVLRDAFEVLFRIFYERFS